MHQQSSGTQRIFIEDITLFVKKGVSGDGYVDPPISEGNILEGDVAVEFPLFRVKFNSLNMENVERLFTVISSIPKRALLFEGDRSIGEGGMWTDPFSFSNFDKIEMDVSVGEYVHSFMFNMDGYGKEKKVAESFGFFDLSDSSFNEWLLSFRTDGRFITDMRGCGRKNGGGWGQETSKIHVRKIYGIKF